MAVDVCLCLSVSLLFMRTVIFFACSCQHTFFDYLGFHLLSHFYYSTLFFVSRNGHWTIQNKKEKNCLDGCKRKISHTKQLSIKRNKRSFEPNRKTKRQKKNWTNDEFTRYIDTKCMNRWNRLGNQAALIHWMTYKQNR